MKRGIVIGTTADGAPWRAQLMTSLIRQQNRYPILEVQAWELQALQIGAGVFDRFVFLPQSTEVLDGRLFDLILEGTASVSLAQHPGPFGMYMGVYQSDVVRCLELPKIETKSEAIWWEDRWTQPYIDMAGGYVAFDDLPHSQVFEERFGRLNMVVQNQWLRRWKGSWMGMSSVAV